MFDNDWKKRLGVVYSTNPDYEYDTGDTPVAETPRPSSQHLVVRIDRRSRGGKQVTLVQGFAGRQEDLESLGRDLRVKLGAGGSVKGGEIVIQGDFRDRTVDFLSKSGYNVKRGN